MYMARVLKSKTEQGRRPMIFDVLPPSSKGRGFRYGEDKIIALKSDFSVKPNKASAQVKKSFWYEAKQGALVGASIVGLIALVFFLRQTLAAFEDKTAHVEFFANSVRVDGAWKNIDQALGEPQVSPEGARADFSEANSAIYEGGHYSLVAENFTTREFIKINVAAASSSSLEVGADSIPAQGSEIPAVENISTSSVVEMPIQSTSTLELDASSSKALAPAATEVVLPSKAITPVEGVPVVVETPVIVSGFENHLPVSNDVPVVTEPSSEISTPANVEPVVSGSAIEVSAPASSESSAEPVSKLDVLKKELVGLVSTPTALAQTEISADDRDTTLGHFRSARVKISLAAFNKAMEVATPAVVEQTSVKASTSFEVIATSSATSTNLEIVKPSSSLEIVSSTSPITRLFNWFGFTKANAQTIDQTPKAVIWYSVDGTGADDSWQELYTVSATDFSNAENGGYLIFSAPFIKAWQDIDNLKIKFQGRTNSGENFVFYLDAIWVEADYDQATKPPQEENQAGFDKNVLEVDGQKITFENTDENVGENLIIKTNRKNYFGLSNAEVYFSVENIGVREEDINLQFYFPSATSGVLALEKLEKNAPYISETPTFEPKIFECANGWEKRETNYECYPSGEKQFCDVVSPNRRYCRLESVQNGTRQEIKYKNRWSEVGLSDLPLSNEKGFWQKVLALGPQEKEVPENLTTDKATRESVDKILPGEVRYYKAVIHFAPNSEGEFYIEAVGSKEGYGLLDPWWTSGWDFRMPITIDNRGGSNTLTDYQTYIQISSSSKDFWRNVKANGGDIRFVDSTETTELNYWTQYFNYTASSTRIWVKVPYVAAASTTKIYLYYGNSSANTNSNQYTPFSYSTIQDLYRVVSVATSTSIQVVSLIDDNSIQVDGGAAVALNRQEVTSFSTYTASSTIKAKGPIGVKLIGGKATAPALPVSFAGTSFSIPGSHGLEIFNVLPILANATSTIYDALVNENRQLILANHSRTIVNDIALDSPAMVEATAPILVSLTTATSSDGMAVYPSSNEDLYGVKSQYNIIGATATSSFNIFCSSRASSSVSSLARGSKQNNTTCTNGAAEGVGEAVRINVKSGSLGAIQQDDSDGRQQTMFLPFRELSSEYMLPTDANYLAVVCAPETATMTLSMYDFSNMFVSSTTCAGLSGRYPGKAYFGTADTATYAAGSRIVSNNGQPFYVYYEDAAATDPDFGGDETNLWGAVQGRKYAYPAPAYSLGAHEIKGPPTGVFNSAVQLGDGSGNVRASIEVDDATNDDCRAKVEYVLKTGASCDFTSPLRPTLSEIDASTTADFGDPKVNNKDLYQIGTSTGWIKTASGTNTVLFSWPTKTNLPAANGDYCLRLTVNDQLSDQVLSATTTLSIDNVKPTTPGNLTVNKKTGTSITFNLPATSTESHFQEYKIFYKVYDGSAVTESNTLFGSSSDADLANVSFNKTSSTTISGLTAGLRYTFNLFAYDLGGNKASSSASINVYANDAPIGYFNSAQQKINGSGGVDISIEADDANDSNTLKAKMEYGPYLGNNRCNFSSPLKPTIDTVNFSSDFGSIKIDNNDAYQVGSTSFWIITSPGANTINFDWLSAADLANATGTYCLRLTLNDGLDDQTRPATTTLIIDNVKPTIPGNLIVAATTYNSVKLLFPLTQPSTDDNPPLSNFYKVFYKQGTAGVKQSDTEHDDTAFDSYNFAGKSSTTVSGLNGGYNYVFNIWAYDAFGNMASGTTEVVGGTDGIVTNKGLTFIDGKATSTVSNIAVADGSGISTFRAQIQDADGWGALNYVELRLANKNDHLAPYDDLKFKWDAGGNIFSEVGADASGMAHISPSSVSNCSNGTCYLDFKIIFNKTFATSSLNYSAQLYSIDTDGTPNTDLDNYTDLFQVRKNWLDQQHYRWRNDDGGGQNNDK